MKTGPKPKPLAERFWAKVAKGDPDSCWLWTGFKMKSGYGTISIGSRSDGSKHGVLVHRVAYELTYGPIADDLYVCHSCDNPPCCNPAHLFPGDQFRNMQDAASKGRLHGNGISGSAHYMRTKTHCKHGHPFDETNTRWLKKGARECITCSHKAVQRWLSRHGVKTAKGLGLRSGSQRNEGALG